MKALGAFTDTLKKWSDNLSSGKTEVKYLFDGQAESDNVHNFDEH